MSRYSVPSPPPPPGVTSAPPPQISATAGVNRVPRPILRSHTSVSSPLSESGLVHRTPTTSPSSCGSLSEFVDTPLLLRQPNDPVFPLAARQQAYNETDV